MSDTAKKIKTIIAKQLEINSERVTDASGLSDDLGTDSLDIIEIVSILEEQFDIEIPDKDSDKIITVGDLISYIEGKMT